MLDVTERSRPAVGSVPQRRFRERAAGPASGAVRVHAAWVAANAVLGYLLVFPALTVVLLWRFVRSRVWHGTVAPFHGAEASAAALVIVVVGTPLVVLTVWANRRLRRRPELRRRPWAVCWPVTAARCSSRRPCGPASPSRP